MKEWFYLIVCWETGPQDIRVYTGTVYGETKELADKVIKEKYPHVTFRPYAPEKNEKYDGQVYTYVVYDMRYIPDDTILIACEGPVHVFNMN